MESALAPVSAAIEANQPAFRDPTVDLVDPSRFHPRIRADLMGSSASEARYRRGLIHTIRWRD